MEWAGGHAAVKSVRHTYSAPRAAHPSDMHQLTRGRHSSTNGARVEYWTGGKNQTMIRKTVDHPRKTVESWVKTTQNRLMARPCYKSFRQNGAAFRRNSHPVKDLALLTYNVEFKSNPARELRLKTTIARTADYRNTSSAKEIGQ